MDWDDLRLFLHVARLGGLSAATANARVSPATLSRRLTRFEAAIGEPIFVRTPTGYRLTEAGEELLARAEQVEESVRDIANWRAGIAPERVVRISAGAWTSHFLCRHIDALWTISDPFRVEFVTAYEKIDIGRHNADVGIRSERPSEAALIARRLCDVAYGIYCADDQDSESLMKQGTAIAVTGDGARLRSTRWLMAHYGDRVALRGNDARTVLDMVRAGAGFSVFPCFVGDDTPGLARIGAPIADLRAEQWLVCHAEARHTRAVRQVLDRTAAFIRAKTRLFAATA